MQFFEPSKKENKIWRTFPVSRGLRERREKTELAEKKKNALWKVPSEDLFVLLPLMHRFCRTTSQLWIVSIRCEFVISSSPSEDVDPTKGTSQLSNCSLRSLIGQAS